MDAPEIRIKNTVIHNFPSAQNQKTMKELKMRFESRLGSSSMRCVSAWQTLVNVHLREHEMDAGKSQALEHWTRPTALPSALASLAEWCLDTSTSPPNFSSSEKSTTSTKSPLKTNSIILSTHAPRRQSLPRT